MFRNLFALIGLAFVLFVVVGWFAKWYTFSRESGKLTILIFTDKVEQGLQDGYDSMKKALTKPEDDKTKPDGTGSRDFFGFPTTTSTPTSGNSTGGTPASLPMPMGGR